MRKIIAGLILCVGLGASGQIIQAGNQRWSGNLTFGAGSPPVSSGGGGGGSTAVGIYGVATNNSTGAAFTLTLTAVPANSWLVVGWSDESDSATRQDAAVSSSPVLTWGKVADASAASSANCEFHTNKFVAGGDITVTIGIQSGTAQSAVLYALTNGASAQVTSASYFTNKTGLITATAKASETTTTDGEMILGIAADFSATAGTAAVASSATIDFNDFQASAYRGLYFHKSVSPAGTADYGMTGPAGATGIGLCLIRITP